MWLLVAREPRPDAPDWPGRRLLAAIDAVAWPLMWVLLIRQVPGAAGLVGPFVTALAVLLGLGGCTARCGSTTATGSPPGAGVRCSARCC